ncbi:MAG: type III pantothenate kinase [Bacteroidia bacterium]|nr:type III pantothenate kinase [Bacteroidia bacterium]
MNLTIDIGNSNTKISRFANNNIIDSHIVTSNQDILELTAKEISDNNINSIIVCSVKDFIPESLISLYQTVNNFIVFSHQTKIPIKNSYLSPETLGLDRLCAAIGAFTLFPNNNCLIIDAGTAITFDLLNNKNEYLGGAISPGLTTRYKALAHFTKRLPELSYLNEINYPGNNTINSIHAGVQYGILYETEGYINNLEKKYNNLKVIITGGDSIFFERNLKKPIFVQPNLVALGLHRILEINEKNI